MSAGVLNQEQVRKELIEGNPPRIKCTSTIDIQPEPSSIDLPLGTEYWEMPASCRPHESYAVSDLIQKHQIGHYDLTEETVFRPNQVYLVRLAWDLELPAQICARSTAKSSIGRLDVLVRLVADHHQEFDKVNFEKTVKLYAEVVPITFSIKVRPGMALSQMRFMRGTEELCTLPPLALEFEDTPVLMLRGGNKAELKPAQGDPDAVLLSLDLSDDEFGLVGFVAKQGTQEAIDPVIRKPKGNEEDRRYNPGSFWEPVLAEKGVVKIERNRFYIFRSKERFRIPPHLAVECQAYAESLGDIRIHYAGFAHPFFGFDRADGTPLIFEVRGHNMDTILSGGDALAKVYFRRMAADATKDDQQVYNAQELQLSACFKEWSAA